MTGIYFCAKENPTIDKLTVLARGDIGLVDEAIRMCGYWKKNFWGCYRRVSDLKDIVDFIVRVQAQDRKPKPKSGDEPMTPTIKAGQQVTLKSGSPPMTVRCVVDYKAAVNTGEKIGVHVDWMDGNERLQSGVFYEEQLIPSGADS